MNSTRRRKSLPAEKVQSPGKEEQRKRALAYRDELKEAKKRRTTNAASSNEKKKPPRKVAAKKVEEDSDNEEVHEEEDNPPKPVAKTPTVRKSPDAHVDAATPSGRRRSGGVRGGGAYMEKEVSDNNTPILSNPITPISVHLPEENEILISGQSSCDDAHPLIEQEHSVVINIITATVVGALIVLITLSVAQASKAHYLLSLLAYVIVLLASFHFGSFPKLILGISPHFDEFELFTAALIAFFVWVIFRVVRAPTTSLMAYFVVALAAYYAGGLPNLLHSLSSELKNCTYSQIAITVSLVSLVTVLLLGKSTA